MDDLWLLTHPSISTFAIGRENDGTYGVEVVLRGVSIHRSKFKTLTDAYLWARKRVEAEI